jgi:predicted AAA+ superfamily ATPase
MSDIKRVGLERIRYLFNHFPCVAVLGARQVGKTTLLGQILPHGPRFDLEKQGDFDRIQRDPDFFLSQYKEPISIDEAQMLPALFPALRVAIDADRKRAGRYLLSGSSSPALLTQLTESLAGRLAVFELGGLTLEEVEGDSSGPLYESLMKGDTHGLAALKPHRTTGQLLEKCVKGGYPEPFLKYRKDPKLFSLWMDSYFQTYIQRDIRALFPGLDIQSYRKFIPMLAGASGQLLNLSEFARSLAVSQPTVRSYLDIAHGTFVWRLLPGYHKNVVKRVVKMPRGHMRDSGLVNHLLRNRSVEDFSSHPLSGRVWEGFVIEEVLNGFANRLMAVESFFYRTHNGAEIDLVLEGDFGLLPIEIKLGARTPPSALTALREFVDEHRLPFGIVINNATETAWLEKKIIQIPAGCL